MKGPFRFRAHLTRVQNLRQGLLSTASTTSCGGAL